MKIFSHSTLVLTLPLICIVGFILLLCLKQNYEWTKNKWWVRKMAELPFMLGIISLTCLRPIEIAVGETFVEGFKTEVIFVSGDNGKSGSNETYPVYPTKKLTEIFSWFWIVWGGCTIGMGLISLRYMNKLDKEDKT